MALVSLSDAKARLRVDGSDSDDDIGAMIAEASDIVVDYVTTEDAEDWDEATAPPTVQAAVKEIVARLYDGGDPFPQAVKDMLRRHRDPSLA